MVLPVKKSKTRICSDMVHVFKPFSVNALQVDKKENGPLLIYRCFTALHLHCQ